MPRDNHSTNPLQQPIELRDLLVEFGWRLVLVESCTAGRLAATLSSLPGISQWLCGSLVVYRCDSKTGWLGVPADLLNDPHVGPVCYQVSRMLAIRGLTITPEAQLAVAVTGDVGPGAGATTDGKIFCACQLRDGGLFEQALTLESPPPTDANDVAGRMKRLEEATTRVFAFTIESLKKLKLTRAAT
jgi:nicotinamide-nucleotide amidase